MNDPLIMRRAIACLNTAITCLHSDRPYAALSMARRAVDHLESVIDNTDEEDSE